VTQRRSTTDSSQLDEQSSDDAESDEEAAAGADAQSEFVLMSGSFPEKSRVLLCCARFF